MSCFITFLILLAVSFLAGPWVLAGIQYRRQREQSSRLATLEGELARLSARLDGVPSLGQATGTAPASMIAVAAPRAGEAVAAALDVGSATGAGGVLATGAEPLPSASPPIVGSPAIASPGAAVPELAGPAMPSAPSAPSVSSAAAMPSPVLVPVATAAAPPLDAVGDGAMHLALDAGAVTSSPSPPATLPPSPPPPPAGAPPPRSTGGVEPPGGGATAPRIEWERWIGVRGAAVLGGVVLALAGILFVRYTIERGLISPAVRIALGILTGLATIAWSQRLRPRGYRINADALAGAGIVLLYAAVWASHALYGFVGAVPAYALMSLITVACGVLSWRNESLLTAVLGLVGGFATPFLLATSSDNPIGLFGYVLLLDLGLIGLARRRGWSALAILALLGTVFYQGFWMLTRLDAGGTLLMLGILGLFALVFGFAGGRGRRGEVTAAPPSFGWIAAEAIGLLAPFAFALYLASRADLGPRLYPVAALLLLLSLAAQWVGRRHGDSDLLSSGAAAGALAVVVVWSWDVVWTPGLVWETVAICVALAAAFHLFFELDRRGARRRVPATERPDVERGGHRAAAGDAGGTDRTGVYARAPAPPTLSSLVAVVGFLALLVLNSLDATDSPWPWLLGAALTAAMVARQSVDDRRAFTPLVAAIGLGAVVAGWFLVARDEPTMPAVELYFGVALLIAVALQLAALAREHGPARRFSEIGAAVYPAILLFALAMGGAGPPPIGAGFFLALTVLFALMLVLAVTRLGSGAGYLIGMVVVAFTHTAWSVSATARGAALLVLVVFGAVVAAFALWPSFAPKLARSTAAWRAAALAAPLWFWSMTRIYEARFGDAAIALVPVVLAAITLGAAYRGRRTWDAEDAAARTSHLAWFGAIVLGLAAIAVPLQLDKEWITVGWALEGLAVTALWRRLDHPGLKWFGGALFAAVTARLLLNPEVLTYHDREGLPILNWLAYTYLVPAACLLGAARILGAAAPREETVDAAEPGPPLPPPAGSSGGAADAAAGGLALEVARARSWEELLYSSLRPLLAAGLVVAAILVVFAWINLTIIDAFATGPTLALSLDRMPARDLTLSLAWVVYAVTLLGFGMARDSGALRWLSLGFLVLSIGKVFLYDLGELKDLYRVASLVGLAFSLMLVSLAYQRFVFRRRADPAA